MYGLSGMDGGLDATIVFMAMAMSCFSRRCHCAVRKTWLHVVVLASMTSCKVIHEQPSGARQSRGDLDFSFYEPGDRGSATTIPGGSGQVADASIADAGASGGETPHVGTRDAGDEQQRDGGVIQPPDTPGDDGSDPRVCSLGGQYSQSTTLGRITCLTEADYRTEACSQACSEADDFDACCEALMNDFRALRASTSELQAAQDGLLGEETVNLAAQDVSERTQAYAWSLDNCAWEGCIPGPAYYYIDDGYYPSDPGPDAPRDSTCFVELCQILNDIDP